MSPSQAWAKMITAIDNRYYREPLAQDMQRMQSAFQDGQFNSALDNTLNSAWNTYTRHRAELWGSIGATALAAIGVGYVTPFVTIPLLIATSANVLRSFVVQDAAARRFNTLKSGFSENVQAVAWLNRVSQHVGAPSQGPR